MLRYERLKRIRIQLVDISQGIFRRVIRGDSQVECGISHRAGKIDDQRALIRILGQAIARLQTSVVTPEPPLAPRNTSSLPVMGGRLAELRRAIARSRASTTAPALRGTERYSRAPAVMQRSTLY